ncbi:MAG TPA: HD domain-containing phosphohydrolase [Polyangiaceae bacterium]|nr:HD domain-containing phosphohydrolase [Polyangiaceae bacterium]
MATVEAPAPKAAKTKRVCDWLVREKLLKPEQTEVVLSHVQRTGDRVEEAILELGLASEAELLKALSGCYQVHFVSSEKLAKADVNRALIDMIPQRFAEKLGLCPVVFDARAHALTVVTADPDDVDALREAQLASGARDVKAVLARPAAVRAFMAKAYGGDIHAFALLDRQAHAQLQAMLNVYDRNLVTDDSMTLSMVRAEAKGRGRERILSEQEIAEAGTATNAPGGGGSTEFLELLNVLVSLLESSRADLRGHSSQVARLARRVAEKMGLDGASSDALAAAAYVHDLGKMGQYHLTAYNCGEYDGHKVAAQKAQGAPGRLLEPVRMAKDATAAVAHMYERYDGKGFPDGASGKDIPLAARVLAICDTYADLTQNPRNPFRKTLSAQEACAALSKHKETIFDPNLVDLFRHTVLGEDLKARLLANRLQALIVDVDPEETTVLELRLIEQGFIVQTARSADQALRVLAEGETDLVISEIDLTPTDGLALLSDARKTSWGKDLPWVVYTRRQERALAQKAFELGVIDFVSKPANADLLVAKLRAMLDQRASPRTSRGVSGRLRELGLPDMVQVLFHGRKSGSLKIRAAEGTGEIHFADGNVVNALWGEVRGEEAFYAMLKLKDGEFGLDPSFRTESRIIDSSSEALLLEGMRRMDEAAEG